MAQPDTLAVPVTVGANPGTPNGSMLPVAGTTTVLKADLRSEYVSGSAVNWYGPYLRALPWAVDDISNDFGDDIYVRMLLDAQVRANDQIFRASVFEDGVRLMSAVQDEDEDGFDLAKTIADTMTVMLDELETPLADVLWNLGDAFALGNRMAELRYEHKTILGKQVFAVAAAKVKPRRSTAFVVDSYSEVKGILAMLPTGFSPVQIGMAIGDLKDQPNVLPREKFAILTFRPNDSDPRGTSYLRPAYHPWWLKQQIIGEWLKYLTQFASPSLIGTTPEGSQAQPVADALGNLILDANGNAVVNSPETAMLAALTSFRNGSALALKGGSTVQLVQSTGTGEAFLAALRWCDQQIAKAILTQTLATEEGEHQARAAASVHQDVLDTLIRQAKQSVVRMIVWDLLRPVIRYTFGEAALRFTPVVSLGQTEQTDFASEAEAVAKLWSAGYLGNSQRADIDKRLGLPERDIAYDEAHAAPITQTQPENVTPIEGEPPEAIPPGAAAPTPITAKAPKQAVAA